MLIINDQIEVRDDERVVLLGKNGIGKTTLIRRALCLGEPIKVTVDGEDFCKKKDYSLLSAVFQEPSTQILGLTCEEELKLQSLFHDVDFNVPKRIMGEFFNVNFYRLSDGYKKRFVISTVLASRPKHVMLDEPFANLDKYSIGLVKEVIPKGSLTTEHRVREVREWGDRFYLLTKDGAREIDKVMLYDEKFLIEKGLRGFKLKPIQTTFGKLIFEHEWIKVREGEVFCIIGRNGAGKTTTLKGLVGKVYLIFQNPDLQFFNPTVRDEVKDDEAIKLFRLQDIADKSPFSLSYGQKMRVLIATAFASPYKVIGLDEPSVGMDGEALLSFYEMIKALKEQGRGIIIATHDEDLISICDTVVDLEERKHLVRV
ncbi:ABC transporter ATP-binding protein [Stygiolobus caldivivus]|uniref:ABC transporter ATP-binding protein n=1 Tax=Stygiolobus caldivivus TaxID=2824673 RepID=A0A8D5ZK94_9CREN|nr:ATP-binding cassette domain-containing protein [Stygiolobus caldivivus]BCU71012.1 ABC transporter ATP-binding protein [Stygiolobus caldivivus]